MVLGAEVVSEKTLGAGNNYGFNRFVVANLLIDSYDWRDEAGNVLMIGGFNNFKDLYNYGTNDPVAWDINQLRTEQQMLQPVHEKYFASSWLFPRASQKISDSDSWVFSAFETLNFLSDIQISMPGGIDFLSYESRVMYGCKLLGYSAADGCAP